MPLMLFLLFADIIFRRCCRLLRFHCRRYFRHTFRFDFRLPLFYCRLMPPFLSSLLFDADTLAIDYIFAAAVTYAYAMIRSLRHTITLTQHFQLSSIAPLFTHIPHVSSPFRRYFITFTSHGFDAIIVRIRLFADATSSRQMC